jgi:SNF2-related domain
MYPYALVLLSLYDHRPAPHVITLPRLSLRCLFVSSSLYTHAQGSLLDPFCCFYLPFTAHIVRSRNTGMFKAVMRLQAINKLCLTGTPFVNSPGDIHSLLCFLRVEPLSDPHVFKTCVLDPLSERNPVGLATLRTTMAHIALRRSKASVATSVSETVMCVVCIRCVV